MIAFWDGGRDNSKAIDYLPIQIGIDCGEATGSQIPVKVSVFPLLCRSLLIDELPY